MVVSARFVPADTKAVPRVGESLLRSPERCCNLAVARRVHSYGGYGGACLIHPREAPATPCAGSNSAATQLYCSPRGEAPPAAYSEVRSTLNSSEREHRRAQGGREGSLFLLPYCIVLPHAAVSLSAGGVLRVRFGRYMHQHLGGGPFDGSQIFAASGRLVMLDRWAAWRRCAVVWVALLRYSFGPRHIQYERDDQRR
jgi:hypothetical protein